MTPVDTSQEMVIFPQAVRMRDIALIGVLAVMGAAVLPVASAESDRVIVGCGLFLLTLCGWLTWALVRKRARGNPDPSLKLSPQGLHLMTGTKGLIPWREVHEVRTVYVGSNKALMIHVRAGATSRLEESPFFKAARKFDTALGIHALMFFQTNVEVPLSDLAEMIHDYSIAHGGPALQPNKTP